MSILVENICRKRKGGGGSSIHSLSASKRMYKTKFECMRLGSNVYGRRVRFLFYSAEYALFQAWFLAQMHLRLQNRDELGSIHAIQVSMCFPRMLASGR